MLICLTMASARMRQATPEQLQLDLSQPRPEMRLTEAKQSAIRSSPTENGDGSNVARNGGVLHVRCHSAAELLQTPGAVLTRSHLRDLGWERRGVDAIFRALPVVAVDGYSRPVIQVEDYLELIQRSTFRDDRVRPMTHTSPAPRLSSAWDG
jgi:hypothetical protein